MKKRKIKLFASVASLAMVVAVMGVGVWAATSQAVKVSTEINFTASAIAADVKLQVANVSDGIAEGIDTAIVKTAYLNSATASADPSNDLTTAPLVIASFANETGNANAHGANVFLTFTDSDDDGYLDVGAKFTYTFSFDIKATGAQELVYQIQTTLPTDKNITVASTGDATTASVSECFKVTMAEGTLTGTNSLTNAASKDGATPIKKADETTRVIVVTYEVTKAMAYSFGDTQNAGSGQVYLGDIKLFLANNYDNLQKISTADPAVANPPAENS